MRKISNTGDENMFGTVTAKDTIKSWQQHPYELLFTVMKYMWEAGIKPTDGISFKIDPKRNSFTIERFPPTDEEIEKEMEKQK
jgi:hypothetical protein